jgi:hypothetical protein
MIMFEQSRRLSEPLRWGRREKAAIGVLLGALAAAAIALGVYALTSGSPARRDCIDVTFASTLGAAKVHACGAQARTACASPSSLGGVAEQLQAACERAGFPFGRPR